MSQSTWLRVDLGTDPGIKTVATLREKLSAAIASGQQVLVNGDDIERIDISALQLLAAAYRSAASAGCAIALSARTDGPLPAALKRAGFVSADGEPLTREGAFWTLSPAAKDEAA